MKPARRVVLLAIAMVMTLIPAAPAAVAAPGDLFISEYIEGSSNNKALEIYNGTGSAVDLAGYSVEMYFNGNTSAGLTINLSGTVADGDVFILAQSSADPTILAQADQTNGAGWFNGDDAVVLRKGTAVVDSIGQVGLDPGTEWGSGLASTQDNTLRRKLDVCAGDTNAVDPFDPGVEWDGFATNTFDGLGSHTPNCGGTGGGTAEIIITEIMYNPASAEDDWEWVEVYNAGDGSADLSGWVIDDINSTAHLAANITAGTVPAGASAVLYNADDVSAADFAAAWGAGMNLVPVTNWSAMALNNGGDTVGLWTDFTSYSGDNVAQANAVESISYDDSGAWPSDNNAGSIYLTDLAADRTDGSNWALSTVGATTPVNDAYQSVSLGGNSGSDVGSPSALPPSIIVDPFGECSDSATLIHAIQGAGLSSPDVGNIRTVEAVVTATFPGVDEIGGYFLQEEDTEVDADPLTSEGLRIFDTTNTPSVGDLVRVRGSVAEFFGLTELNNVIDFATCGTGSATAADVILPVGSVDDFERYEGMYVTFPQGLVISEYFNFDRFGEIVLTSQRNLTPTAEVEPGPDAIAEAQAYLLDRITLDDGRSNQNPDPAIHPNGGVFDLNNLFRGGDMVANVTGVLDYSFGLYRVQPTQGADYTSANPRTASPDDVGGRLEVATFNVLNYFTTLDNAGPICGPVGGQDCRGADNAEEFTRQRDKIIAALVEIDADIVGLTEIENNATDFPTADLVAGLNDVMGAGTYDYVATGAIGTDAIRVAFIYKPATVSPSGAYAVLDASVDARFNDDRNRPALAQTFVDGTNAKFTVAVNHLKSKGSACDDIGDPNTGDGSGNCNLTRKMAAEALVDWLATDPTASGDPDVLIIGDLNSYDKEDPIDAILAGSDDVTGSSDDYTDLIFDFVGEDAYSYVFDGQIGYLDYQMANTALAPQVTGTTVWHINADEPDLIDYDTSFKQPAQDAIYAPDPYRSSDHDPVIVGLDLNASPTCEFAEPSIGSIWPPNHKLVDIEILGCTDADGDAITITVDTISQDEPVNGEGDGDTAPDGDGIGTSIAQVRAERSGEGDGRVYHIGFTATDAFGNTTTGEVIVEVRLSKKQPAVDGGAIYDSTIVP